MAVGRLSPNELVASELATFQADLVAFGMPEAYIAAAMADFGRRAAPEEDFQILPANTTAVRLFQALQTQWRTTAISTLSRAIVVRTGLDYGAIEPLARLRRIELEDDDFTRLQIMEVAALNAFSEEARG